MASRVLILIALLSRSGVVSAQEAKGHHWSWPCRLAGRGGAVDSVAVRLDEGGHVMIKRGDRWHSATLDEVQMHLLESIRRDHVARRAEGKSGYEVLGGRKVPRLFLDIDAHPNTPWRHVGWVMGVGVESHFVKLQLRVATHAMRFFPQQDSSHVSIPIAEAKSLRVHILSDREVDAEWNGIAIRKPTAVMYGVDDEKVGQLVDVVRYLKAKKGASGAEWGGVVGIITADATVPADKVVEVFDALVGVGIKHVDFRGFMSLPPLPDRKAKVLRYPATRNDLSDRNIDVLINLLEHREFEKREAATNELLARGRDVRVMLFDALGRIETPRARARIRHILGELGLAFGEDARIQLEFLVRLTRDVAKLADTIAKGTSDSWRTIVARELSGRRLALKKRRTAVDGSHAKELYERLTLEVEALLHATRGKTAAEGGVNAPMNPTDLLVMLNKIVAKFRAAIRHHGDLDDDGMPADWEIENNLDPTRDDSEHDSDGDGRNNLREYRDGTNPNRPD